MNSVNFLRLTEQSWNDERIFGLYTNKNVSMYTAYAHKPTNYTVDTKQNRSNTFYCMYCGKSVASI